MSVKRFDSGELQKPVVDPKTGWVRADGYIARTGIQVYHRQDGSEIREYRPPEEVFHPDALDSFNLVPLTNDHPPEGLLTADNATTYTRGMVVAPSRDGNKVRAQFQVTDAKTIKALKSGKVQLSCGYVCDLDETPGVTPEGEHYDARQVNIRGNHVALVAAGRAGPEVRIRMDSKDAEFAISEPIRKESGNREDRMAFKIDGVDYEMSDTAAQAVAKALEAREAATTAVKADLEKATAKADALEADLKKAQDESKAALEKAKADAKERFDLEAKAKEILGTDKFDGMSNDKIKATVAEKVTGVKLDGKNSDYIQAAFDLALVKADKKDDEARLDTVHEDSSSALEKAKAAHAEFSRNAYKLQ